MAWATSTFTHTNAGNVAFEDVATFGGAGESSNAVLHAHEPSGAGVKMFYVVGSIDGVTYRAVDGVDPINLFASEAQFSTETEAIVPFNFAMPFYKILLWVATGTKTVTFNLAEEIRGVELNTLNQG